MNNFPLKSLLLLLSLMFALSACRQTNVITVTAAPTSTPAPTPSRPPTSTSIPAGGGNGQIAFASYRDGESELYLINADGSGLTRLTHHAARVSQPAWSPDGETIALVLTGDQSNLDVYVMDADGSDQTRLTTHRNVDTEPAWSPDGERIAFSSDRDSYVTLTEGQIYEFEIYVMKLDGSELANLTNSRGWDTSPAWSPDGKHIAFQSDRDGNPEIYVMNADGSQQTNLTHHPADDASPVWSPDGKRIAFHSNRDGVFNIYVIDVRDTVQGIDGSGLTQLTTSPQWDIDPAWSPDGERIAFYSRRDRNFEIYVMNADGSEQSRLTFDDDFDGFPSWHP